jgi:hypothetical protein
MHPNLATSLARGDELLKDLLAEYDSCLKGQSVSERAVQLTHDICVQLRSILDRTARRYWDRFISPSLSEQDRKRAKVYFPIAQDSNGFNSILGQWRWKQAKDKHQSLHDYLLSKQPFSAGKNSWLSVINDLAIAGKHIDLIPQKRLEERRTTVIREDGRGAVSYGGNSLSLGDGGSIEFGPGGTISFGQGGVRFSGNVSALGAPIDPTTQRITPTPGVTDRIERWVSFIISDHNVNAADLCNRACKETRNIVNEMSERFGLS